MADVYKVFYSGSDQRATKITAVQPRTPRTLTRFWCNLASVYSEVYSFPAIVLGDDRRAVRRNCWLDEDIPRCELALVEQSVTHVTMHTPAPIAKECCDWKGEEESLAAVPSFLAQGKYKDYLPRRGARKKDGSSDPKTHPRDLSSALGRIKEGAFRALLIVLREIDEYSSFADEVLDIELPHDFTPGTSEGVCSTIRKVITTTGHQRITNEVLRAVCVLRRGTAVPTEEEREEIECDFGDLFTKQARDYCNNPQYINEQFESGFTRLRELEDKNPMPKQERKRKRGEDNTDNDSD